MPAPACQSILKRKHLLAPNIFGLELQIPETAEWNLKPGQHVALALNLTGEEKPIVRYYSVASSPDEGRLLKLCVSVWQAGKGADAVNAMKEGDAVTVNGPMGNFKIEEPLAEEIFFASNGTGIAPFRGMIRHLLGNNFGNDLRLYHGSRHEDSILYDSEFRALAEKHPNFKYCPCISQPKNPASWKGRTGYVQKNLQEDIGNADNKQVYLCGYKDMLNQTTDILKARGFDPATQIFFEKYG